MQRLQTEESQDELFSIFTIENEKQWQQLSAAEGYAELGMFAEAHQQLDLADEYHDFRLEVAVRKLDLFVLEKRWKDAVIFGEILTEFLPEEQAPLMKYATALHELGHTDRAIHALSLAADEFECDPEYQFRLAGYEIEAGSRTDALRHLENAIALDPKVRTRAWVDPILRPLIAELPWEPRFVHSHPESMELRGVDPSDSTTSTAGKSGFWNVEFSDDDEEDSNCPF